MALQCRLIDYQPGITKLQPGDMWYTPFQNEQIERYYLEHILSDQYKRDWHGKRPPICVRLPNGHDMCIDAHYTGTGKDGWKVTGEAPNITVWPSINYAPSKPYGWHGWLQNGVMTDDLDGRIYEGS